MLIIFSDVTKHRTVRTGAKYRSWVLVKCVWCGACYWFWLRKGTDYGFHAFLTCILLLLLLIQCKISPYWGTVWPVRPVRCFVTPNILWHPLGANQYGGPSWRTGFIFSCCKGLWDWLSTKPITTKHQSVFWLVSQSRLVLAICVGICRWILLVMASAARVVGT